MSTGPFCYLIFCAICSGVAAYTYFIIPETKNKTFMEISQMFAAKNNLISDELGPNSSLKLDLMNGYGSLGHRDEKWSCIQTNRRLISLQQVGLGVAPEVLSHGGEAAAYTDTGFARHVRQESGSHEFQVKRRWHFNPFLQSLREPS